MFRTLVTKIRSFAEDTNGSQAVEAALAFPMVVWALAAGFNFYEGYRSYAVAEKAAYTVSDMISRETLPINGTYITNMRKIYRDLSGLSNSETALRVTVLRWDESDNRFYIDWAKRRGDIPRLRNRDVGDYDSLLPPMVDNERIILVETASDFTPALDLSGLPFLGDITLSDRTIETFVFTRPRFAPQLIFDANA